MRPLDALSAWDRLSLTTRLLVVTGVTLVVATAMLLFTSLEGDAAASRAATAERLGDEIVYLAKSVSEEAVTGDYATLKQRLVARAERSDVDAVGWLGEGANPIMVTHPPVPLQAPAWFALWVNLSPAERWEPIVVGGREYGRIFLRFTPVPSVNLLWGRFTHNLQIMLLGMGLVFSAVIVVITKGLTPLTDLAASARRFGAGDHTARMPVAGPEEIRSTVTAFNAMADNIEVLLESLQRNQAILLREKERAQVTLESIADAVITTDIEGRLEYMNPVAVELTGRDAASARGLPLSQVLRVLYEDSQAPVEDVIGRVMREHVVGDVGRSLLLSRGDENIAIETTASPIRDREGRILGAVVVFRDVSHARIMAHQLSWQATHDPLTGLINRREFERRLGYLVESTRADDYAHCLLYIDMDQFKIVNDTCGHIAGDQLLRQVADLLSASIRDSDTLARLGGDEFGVLLEGCRLERATMIAGKMLDDLARFRFVWQNNTFVVGASIGLIAITDGERGMPALLSAADAACYSAKEKGRNRVQIYRPDDRELALRHGEMQWVSRLNQAMEQDRWRLYYQPIVPVGRHLEEGDRFEILLRLVDEKGEPVPPMAFIPAAERYNLMPAIDRMVIGKALAAFRDAYQGNDALHCASINVSGSSLGDESFLDFVKERIARSGISPELICFEITETAAIANLSHATSFIRELRALGCKFALDDFGSGLSSFAYLKNLTVDYLKIAGSFIRDMESDPIDSAIVRAITHVGHQMGLKIIAEFVETDIVLGMLKEVGVDYAQGYGIAVPEPLAKLHEAIRRRGPVVVPARRGLA